MSLRCVMVFLMIPVAPLLAQIANNTVTVTASKSSTAQPDEAVFAVTVSSGVDKSLDDVVAAVSGLGIAPANLVGVSSTPPPIVGGFPVSSLGWTFRLTVPLSKTKDTTAALTSLQKNISQNNSGLMLSFSLTGTRVSGQQASNCNLADLVAQTRVHAQQIASAAGLNAGTIVGLTSATTAPLVCSLTARYALGTMFGQLGPNSITITATRTNNLQPDQVLLGLIITSGTTAGLDDITSALTGAGISGTSFTSVYATTIYPFGSETPHSVLVWSFTLPGPLAKLLSTVSQVLSAQQTISGNNSGLTLAFYVEGLQVSQQLQQSQSCPQAALLADSQAQAKAVAAAAGVTTGPILSMAEGSAAIGASLQLVPALETVAGDFFAGVGTSSFAYASLLAVQPTCSLTVQFQLI